MDVGGSAHDDQRYYDARGDNLMTSRQYLVSFLLFGFLSFAIQGQGYADELKILPQGPSQRAWKKSAPNLKRARDTSSIHDRSELGVCRTNQCRRAFRRGCRSATRSR
jgi:hypothetical protein